MGISWRQDLRTTTTLAGQWRYRQINASHRGGHGIQPAFMVSMRGEDIKVIKQGEGDGFISSERIGDNIFRDWVERRLARNQRSPTHERNDLNG